MAFQYSLSAAEPVKHAKSLQFIQMKKQVESDVLSIASFPLVFLPIVRADSAGFDSAATQMAKS